MAKGRKHKKVSAYALKTAFHYSAHLRTWERATISGDKERAEEAAQGHEHQFNYRRGSSRSNNGG